MEYRKRRSNRVSDYVCPREFLQLWNVEAFQATKLPKLIPDTVLGESSRSRSDQKNNPEEKILDQIGRMMDVDDDTIQELSDVCGKHTLYNIEGNDMKFKAALIEVQGVPDDVQLDCVKHQIEQRKKRKADKSLQIACNRQMKYNVMYEYLKFQPQGGEDKSMPEPEYQVQVPNTVLTVTLHKCLQTGESGNRHRECDTFEMLGSQPLSALRDKISCTSDCIIPGDYSNMTGTDPTLLHCSGDMYKSSLFFIENTFYNDTRHHDHENYSKSIINWAEKEIPETHYGTLSMEETYLQDMRFRMGCHYLFMHQGNCEHSLLFTDIRLFNSEDAQDIRLWPQLTIERVKNRCVCQSCFKFSAKWIVKDSPMIPSDPCILCKFCFKSMLYTEDGQKKSDFKAYHMKELYTRDKEGDADLDLASMRLPTSDCP